MSPGCESHCGLFAIYVYCYPEKFCFFDNILPGMCCKFLQSQALRTAHFPMTLFPSFPLLPSVTSFGCGFAALSIQRFTSLHSPRLWGGSKSRCSRTHLRQFA